VVNVKHVKRDPFTPQKRGWIYPQGTHEQRACYDKSGRKRIKTSSVNASQKTRIHTQMKPIYPKKGPKSEKVRGRRELQIAHLLRSQRKAAVDVE